MTPIPKTVRKQIAAGEPERRAESALAQGHGRYRVLVRRCHPTMPESTGGADGARTRDLRVTVRCANQLHYGSATVLFLESKPARKPMDDNTRSRQFKTARAA